MPGFSYPINVFKGILQHINFQQLEKLRSAGEEGKTGLQEHIATMGTGLNYRRTEQVWENYYKTIFTLGCVSKEIREAGQQAAQLAKKVLDVKKLYILK